MLPKLSTDKLFLKLVQEGRLKISPDGHVVNTKTGQELGSTASGYLRIFARDSKGKCQGIGVHRLVYLVYKGRIPRGKVVNHKDGNKLNNHVDNLEVMSYSENTKHAFEKGLAQINDLQKRQVSKRSQGSQNVNSKFTWDQIESIRLRGHQPVPLLAKEFRVHPKTIRNIIKGVTYNVQNYYTNKIGV